MPTVIATPGAANANSYATVAEANAYMDTRLYSTTWDEAEDVDKERAVISATTWLDALFRWTGSATDAVQALGWPRNGMLSRNGYPIANTVIPSELKKAVSEFAIALDAEQRTADNDAANQGLEEIEAGPVRLKFKDKFGEIQTVSQADAMVLLAGPDYAYLSRFVPDSVRALIPPSWYIQPTIAKGIYFEADR